MASNPELLFESMPVLELPGPSGQQSRDRRRSTAEATFTPTAAGLRPDPSSLVPMSPRMSNLISEAIKHVVAGLQQRAFSVASDIYRARSFQQEPS